MMVGPLPPPHLSGFLTCPHFPSNHDVPNPSVFSKQSFYRPCFFPSLGTTAFFNTPHNPSWHWLLSPTGSACPTLLSHASPHRVCVLLLFSITIPSSSPSPFLTRRLRTVPAFRRLLFSPQHNFDPPDHYTAPFPQSFFFSSNNPFWLFLTSFPVFFFVREIGLTSILLDAGLCDYFASCVFLLRPKRLFFLLDYFF